MNSKIPTAPQFSFGPPSKPLLDELVGDYTAITGDPVRRPRKRDLVAACYRVHGPDFIPFVRDFFRVEGSAQNLLGVIRNAVRRHLRDDFETYVELDSASDLPVDGDRDPGHSSLPCPVAECLPNLMYCADHSPAFDGRSSRRHDRRRPVPSSEHSLPDGAVE